MKRRIVLFYANAAAGHVAGKYSGIGRVTYELLQGLSKIDDTFIKIEILSEGLKTRKPLLKEFELTKRHFFTPNNPVFQRLHIHLPIRDLILKYDLLHIPHNFEYVSRPDKCIVTVHDMIMFTEPQDFPASVIKDQLKVLPRLLNGCKGIITCSESSKKDIAQYMNIELSKIKVIPWGVRHDIFKPIDKNHVKQILSKILNINFPYFFSVSCGVNRKNTDVLIKAYSGFIKKSPKNHLVLIWPKIPLQTRELIDSYDLENRIHIIDHVDDMTLSALYNGATSLLFPSTYEGFGLPVLESLACGTPVVVGKNSSLTEVGGNAAIYITNTGDSEEWEQKMEMLEAGNMNIREIKEQGISHAQKYTWANNANSTVEFYKQLLKL